MKSLSKHSFFFLISTLSCSLLADEAAPIVSSIPQKQSLMQYSVEAKERAQDYIQAFEMLRKEKTASKVKFSLKDGSILANIIEIQLMENGSLLLFRYNSSQGIRFRIVGLEEILRLEHL